MIENNFAGEMLLEWFEQNREVLVSRGFQIDSLLRNPEAYWIEPAAMINFQTPYYLGQIEITVDGRCSIIALHLFDDSQNWHQNFLSLEPAAIKYRSSHSYDGDSEGVNWKPQFIINQPNDYSTILEPIINQLLQPNPNQP